MAKAADSDCDVGASIRRLVRALDRASLATLRSSAGDWPYASLVLVACDLDASPILLISGLAEHTRNILSDDRVSLLYDGTAGMAEPLTGARVSLQGRAFRTDDEQVAHRFRRRHRSAEGYAGFADFGFWRIAVDFAHLVAGFGQIHWIEWEKVRFDVSGCEALAEAEGDIVSHMNEDHADAVALFARSLEGRRDGAWRMTGIDPEGCDLTFDGESVRIDFEAAVKDPESARRELVRLTRLARQNGAR